MKRTLEKLRQERVEKEKEYARQAGRLEKTARQSAEDGSSSRLADLLSRLENESSQTAFHAGVLEAMRETGAGLSKSSQAIARLAEGLLDLFRLSLELMDAKDKEWDGLGSNHVGMIFKSLEWRVEELSAEHKDVRMLMRSFLALEDKLKRLLSVLEDKKLPTAADVEEVLEPVKDWRYAGFENRFRGSEAQVREQQSLYVEHFKKGGTVLDLGCGRGEFMEMLRDRGIESVGIDLNSQTVGLCRDKGLDCRQGDILETLAGWKDGSLDGLFSSQVIEHLAPPSIQRLVELAFAKLAPGGTIVLETINPLSVFALVHIYMLDLSHKTPVHPGALKFLLEASGFEDISLQFTPLPDAERLRSVPGADDLAATLNRNFDELNELLYAAPNYAAIARKR